MCSLFVGLKQTIYLKNGPRRPLVICNKAMEYCLHLIRDGFGSFFFQVRSSCFSELPPQKSAKLSKILWKRFGKEFRWTKFIAVERVTSPLLKRFIFLQVLCIMLWHTVARRVAHIHTRTHKPTPTLTSSPTPTPTQHHNIIHPLEMPPFFPLFSYAYIKKSSAQKRLVCAQKSSGRPAIVWRTAAWLLL